MDRRLRTTDHGYTISSPCEPEGSGELKNIYLVKSSNFNQTESNTSDLISNNWISFEPRSEKIKFLNM